MYIARELLEDKKLYKFRHIHKDASDPSVPDPQKLDYVERIFTHNELFFPGPSDLNDLHECKPFIRVGELSDEKYREEFIAYAKSHMTAGIIGTDTSARDRWLNNLNQEQANNISINYRKGHVAALEDYRICSFCATPTNPIVWSHYANSHQGFCLVFDADNDVFGSALRVDYSDEYPSMDVIEDNAEVITKVSILTKYSGWNYEEEYRLVSKEPGYPDGLEVTNKKWIFPENMLIGVILGNKISESDQALVNQWCDGRPNVFVKKAVPYEDRFVLNVVD